jgi:peptide/nickel transport system permease protein
MGEAAMEDTGTLTPLALALRRLVAAYAVRISLGLVLAIALMAIYAPFLCNEVALVWRDGSGLRFPVLRHLFNANEYRQGYDLWFNLLGLLLPIYAVAWFALRRHWSVARRLKVALLTWIALCTIAMVPLGPLRALYSERPETPETIRSYRALPEESRPWALFPPMTAKASANYAGSNLLAPGSANAATGGIHLLGTDDRTKDVLATMVYGARVSLTIGFLSTAIVLAIGVIVGAVSGYAGGWVDLVIQRIVEIVMCFPSFMLILVVVSILGPKLIYIILVIGFTGWAGVARLVRGEYLAQAGRDYVLAAESLGIPRWRIMFGHILPNVLTPLIINATFGVAGAIGSESGLAFLGLGDPDAPSWGTLLEQGRNHPQYLWLVFTPGLLIFILVYTFNVIGTGLRDALDPKVTR